MGKLGKLGKLGKRGSGQRGSGACGGATGGSGVGKLMGAMITLDIWSLVERDPEGLAWEGCGRLGAFGIIFCSGALQPGNICGRVKKT